LSILEVQVVLLNEPDKLANLVRLGFSADLLEIQGVVHIRMNQDVMAAVDSRQLETEGTSQLQKVLEREILGAIEGLLEELAWIHDPRFLVHDDGLHSLSIITDRSA
jgi:hypothetical protein